MSVSVDNFKPLNDYVVVLIPKIKDRTEKGILKSEKMKEDELKDMPQVFKVVAIGPNVNNEYSQRGSVVTGDVLSTGKYILCTRINQIPVDSLDEDYLVAVVKAYDIIGVTDEV